MNYQKNYIGETKSIPDAYSINPRHGEFEGRVRVGDDPVLRKGDTLEFPTYLLAETEVCYYTKGDGQYGLLSLHIGLAYEYHIAQPNEIHCINRKWGGVPLFASNIGEDDDSNAIIVHVS